MKAEPAFYVKFWATAQANSWPLTWVVNREGPLDAAKRTTHATMQQNTFPMAVRYTVHEYASHKQVYP